MSSNIKLIVFDAGGVMVRICHGGWKQACEQAGIQPPEHVDDEAISPELIKSSQLFETGKIDASDFAQRVSVVTGLTVKQTHAVIHTWLIEPYPGIHAFVDHVIETCNAKQITTALLSNTNPPHWHLMKTESHASIPVNHLHHQFISFEIGVMKPDTGIYEHVEQATGIAPEHILFFDDAPANIETAQARGWRTMRIDHHGDPVEQMTACLVDRGVL